MSDARRIGDLLRAKDSVLSTLVRGAQRQQALDQQFKALIDAPIAEHVHVASTENGILTLAADTSVWGHRIRYLAPAVLERLRGVDSSLREVKIIVRPPRTEASVDSLPIRGARLSETSAALIERVAASCANPKLARILQRLSKLSQRPQSNKEP